MPDESQEMPGCVRDFAAVIAICVLSAISAFILSQLGINPWWAPLVGIAGISLYLIVAIIAGKLERAAGAAFLRRTERERLLESGQRLRAAVDAASLGKDQDDA